jgi:hypothetical protein
LTPVVPDDPHTPFLVSQIIAFIAVIATIFRLEARQVIGYYGSRKSSS